MTCTICLGKPTATIKDVAKKKPVNKNLGLDVSTANSDRPIAAYFRSLNNTRNEGKASLNKRGCSNVFKSVQPHRLQNPINILIVHLIK